MIQLTPTFWVGLSADTFTFAGAVLLAIDAPQRLEDLQAIRTQAAFEKLMSGIPIASQEDAQARRSVRRGFWGMRVITLGFLLQPILRFFP